MVSASEQDLGGQTARSRKRAFYILNLGGRGGGGVGGREREGGIFCLFLPRFNLNVCNATKTPSSKYAFVSKQNNVFTSPKEPQHESALTKECG